MVLGLTGMGGPEAPRPQMRRAMEELRGGPVAGKEQLRLMA